MAIDNPVDNIMQFRMGETAASNAFKFLVEYTKDKGLKTKQNVLDFLAVTEKEYMDQFYPDHYKMADGTFERRDPEKVVSKGVYCKDRGGEYKYRTFLPNSYSSAKSVISNAIEKNINVFDTSGKAKGKTALQQELKDTKGLSQYNKAMQHLKSMIKIFDSLTITERVDLLDSIETFIRLH